MVRTPLKLQNFLMPKQCPNNVQTMFEQVWTLFGHQNFLEIEFQGCADYQNSFLSLDKFRNEFLMIDTSLRPHFLGNFWCPNKCLDIVRTLFGHCLDIRNVLEKRVSEVCRPSETHCLTNPWSQTKNRGQKKWSFFFGRRYTQALLLGCSAVWADLVQYGLFCKEKSFQLPFWTQKHSSKLENIDWDASK